MTAATPVVLCADDFGISPGVCGGILELLEAGHLSAVGCMATGAALSEFSGALGKHADRMDIGLHLVLTDQERTGAPTSLAPGGRFLPISDLMKRVFLGGVSKADVETELNRQVDTFVDTFGRPPDFLDGHHHIHQLPGIRDVVVKLAVEKLRGNPPWLRATNETLPLILRRGIDPLKAVQVGLFGGAFRRRAERWGLRTNAGFSGVYDLTGKVPYARLFERFVTDAGPGTLVMCHPGHVDDELRRVDDLTDQRQVEWDYFASCEFARLLETRNLRLARLTGE